MSGSGRILIVGIWGPAQKPPLFFFSPVFSACRTIQRRRWRHRDSDQKKGEKPRRDGIAARAPRYHLVFSRRDRDCPLLFQKKSEQTLHYTSVWSTRALVQIGHRNAEIIPKLQFSLFISSIMSNKKKSIRLLFVKQTLKTDCRCWSLKNN